MVAIHVRVPRQLWFPFLLQQRAMEEDMLNILFRVLFLIRSLTIAHGRRCFLVKQKQCQSRVSIPRSVAQIGKHECGCAAYPYSG